jgi:hypothetical protein
LSDRASFFPSSTGADYEYTSASVSLEGFLELIATLRTKDEDDRPTHLPEQNRSKARERPSTCRTRNWLSVIEDYDSAWRSADLADCVRQNLVWSPPSDVGAAADPIRQIHSFGAGCGYNGVDHRTNGVVPAADEEDRHTRP